MVTSKRQYQIEDEEDEEADTFDQTKRVQIDECAVAIATKGGDVQKELKTTPGPLGALKTVLLILLETEAWAVLVSVTIQDAPFFLVRVISILRFRFLTYTNCFFATKNFIVLVLQLYRVYSLYVEQKAFRKAQMKARRDMWLVKVRFLDYPDPKQWKKARPNYNMGYFKF